MKVQWLHMQNYDPYDLVVACESKWSTIVLEIVGYDAHSFKQTATMSCLFEKRYTFFVFWMILLGTHKLTAYVLKHLMNVITIYSAYLLKMFYILMILI